MKITINGNEYDTEKFSEQQNEMLATVQQGDNAGGLLNFMLNCVRAVREEQLVKLEQSLKTEG